METVKIQYRDQIHDAEIHEDNHFFGGKKVIFKSQGGTTYYLSIHLVKIIENN